MLNSKRVLINATLVPSSVWHPVKREYFDEIVDVLSQEVCVEKDKTEEIKKKADELLQKVLETAKQLKENNDSCEIYVTVDTNELGLVFVLEYTNTIRESKLIRSLTFQFPCAHYWN